MSGRIKVLLMIAVFLTAVCSFSESQAWPWSKKKKDNKPLYEDLEGWEIRSAMRGYMITDRYRAAKSIVENMPGVSGVTIEYWEYIIKRGEDNFLGLTLIIPDGLHLFWSPESEITVIYLHKQDTLQAASTEFFFANACPTCKPPMVLNSEIKGFYSVPNQSVFCTPAGNPVVFAHFDFKKKPDRLLGCTISNVLAHASKEVSRR